MKKIVSMLMIIGIVLFSTQSFAGKNSKISLVGKLGYFTPDDFYLEYVVGGGFTFGGGVKMNISPNLSLLGTVEYWNKGYKEIIDCWDEYGKILYPCTVKMSYIIIPKCITGIYNIPVAQKGLIPYLGAGIGYYSLKTEMKFKSLSYGDSESAIGFHIVAGVDYIISPQLSINGDLKFASAKVEEDKWNMEDIGGTTFGAGVTFSF